MTEYVVNFVRNKQYRIYDKVDGYGKYRTDVITIDNNMDVYDLCTKVINSYILEALINHKCKLLLDSEDENKNQTRDLYTIQDIVYYPLSNKIMVFVQEVHDMGGRFIDKRYLDLSWRELDSIVGREGSRCREDYYYTKYNEINYYSSEILQKIPEWDEKIKSEFYKQNTEE